MQKKVFISHISEEASLAKILNEWIESTFIGTVDVFISSDEDDIPPGSLWFSKIDSALNDSNLTIILCSKQSIVRPWINFEAGCSWIKGIPIIPICHTGITKSELPTPLSNFQALDLGEKDFSFKLINSIASHFDIKKIPKISFQSMQNEIASSISSLERIQDSKPILDEFSKTCFKLGYDYFVFLGLHIDKSKIEDNSNIINLESKMIKQYLNILGIDISLPNNLVKKSYKEIVDILHAKFNEIIAIITAISGKYLIPLKYGEWLGSVLTYVSVSKVADKNQVESLLKPFHVEFQEKLKEFEGFSLPEAIKDKYFDIDKDLEQLIKSKNVRIDDYNKISKLVMQIVDHIDKV